jgi:hypothetical protein
MRDMYYAVIRMCYKNAQSALTLSKDLLGMQLPTWTATCPDIDRFLIRTCLSCPHAQDLCIIAD